jgi:DNA-binding LacI/PurR family transcriptional regulator
VEAVPASGKRPSIADVAKAAKVGVGTVSRVLNGSPLVKDETQRHVHEAIHKLGYRPSSLARRLSLGRSMTIAVILPFVTQPWAAERLRGLVARVARSGYDLVLFDVESVAQRDHGFRMALDHGRADGLIIIALTPTDEEVHALRQARMPVVLVGGHHPELPCIEIDDTAGGMIAVRHLLELGHRRIGFVGDSPENPIGFTPSSQLRLRGYQRALLEAGISPNPELVREGPHGAETAEQLAAALLRIPEPPTAIFAASDTQALGVLEAARKGGRAVPGELSVIGFDDVSIAHYVGLTTVRQPLRASGERGAELLLGALDNNELRPANEVLDIELVVRATTGPAGR